MRHSAFSFAATLSMLALASPMVPVYGLENPPSSIKNSDPFTGRVTRNKVRLRAGADLNSPVLLELEQSALLEVTGEEDSFYAVKPPKELKAYVYRTYVLDNVVDGAHVNVRAEPALEAPVIAQLNKGDRVDGKISAQNSKWLEIALPPTSRFFVSKEFVERAGPADMLVKMQARREEAARLINNAFANSQMELQKPLDEARLEPAIAELNRVMTQYQDVPAEVSRAKNYLASIQASYQQKRDLAKTSGEEQETLTQPQSENLAGAPSFVQEPHALEAMSNWLPKEAAFFETWLAEHPNQTMDDFYAEQRRDAVQLKGMVQPYTRPVKNKPGNFLLVSHLDSQPIAFLYSTQVDLTQKAGQVVSLVGCPRPSNHFAFPAFFVVSED